MVIVPTTIKPPAVISATSTPDGKNVLFHTSGLKASILHGVPALIEGVIGPALLFYLVLLWAGFRTALWAALGWSLLALVRRIVRHERVPGTLWIGTGLLVIRTAISLFTGSAVAYFAQPTATTALIGVAFAVSALAGKPIIERLALDFCPFDPHFLARAGIRRFFVRLSFLWSATMLVNAGSVLGLLLTTSLRTFVLARTLVSWSLSGAAIAISVYAFFRVMRGEGIHVRFHRHAATTA